MKRILIIASLILLGAFPSLSVNAQTPAPQVIGGTVPISHDLRVALETYLGTYPPSSAPYYAPTYAEDHGTYSLVSLAGLNLQSPDEAWSMEARDNGAPSKVLWVGTVKIYLDGSGEIFASIPSRSNTFHIPHLATLIIPGPGGGANIRFPWQVGTSMMYGPRKIHGLGDYGTSGAYAVDLVGGDGMGSNIAPDVVYAAGLGTVDYVCTDDTSVAVATINSPTNDYWMYAHLLPNANIELSHVFAQGAPIGSLKHGSFNDTCGWADQGATNYHVHWMFVPSGGAGTQYRVSGCVLDFSDKNWHCGGKTIGAGGLLPNTPSSGGVDDPSGTGAYVPSIWDNIIGGIVLFVTGTANLLPVHNSPAEVLRGIVNTVVMFFRLAWILGRSNLNLGPVAVILIALIIERTTFGIIWLIFWAIRVVRLLKQTIAF